MAGARPVSTGGGLGPASNLLVVRPQSEHLHGLSILEDLVDQAMLNADAPREYALDRSPTSFSKGGDVW